MRVIRPRKRKGESEADFVERRERLQAEALELPPLEPGDAAPKQQRKERTPRATSQKTAIEALLAMPNTLLLIVPPTREDALNESEVDALATALDHYQQKDERARRTLHKLLAASTVAELLSVLLVLAIPRLARHGLLPQVAAQHLANYAAESAGVSEPPIVGAPAPPVNGYANPYASVVQ